MADYQELKMLKELLDEGVLTQEEFDIQKKIILSDEIVAPTVSLPTEVTQIDTPKQPRKNASPKKQRTNLNSQQNAEKKQDNRNDDVTTLKSLSCPNCGASLEIEDGIDTFFCKFCGHKILLDGLSEHVYEAKVRVKDMEHQERLIEKQQAQERYKIETRHKLLKNGVTIYIIIYAAILFLLFIGLAIGEASNKAAEKHQEQELQGIVDQIMIDIEDENFTSAYIQANSLYWDDDYSTEAKKWNSIRKTIFVQIEAAEIEATGKSTNTYTEEEPAEESTVTTSEGESTETITNTQEESAEGIFEDFIDESAVEGIKENANEVWDSLKDIYS
jgi:DNA-directed RNA polymerase subunit RPC12/RpoP